MDDREGYLEGVVHRTVLSDAVAPGEERVLRLDLHHPLQQ
jgi:hypothetical protein